MNTKIINIDKDNIDGEALKEAGQIIRDGSMLHFQQKRFMDWVQMHLTPRQL